MVEILAASTASRDRGEKKGIYARNGVREYWLVDPRSRDAQIFTLAGDRYGPATTFADGDRLKSEVLEGLMLEVSALFP